MHTIHATACTLGVLGLAAGCAASQTNFRAELGETRLPGLIHNPTDELSATAASSAPARSQAKPAEDQELAKKLSNPVASMISVPFQFNYDEDIGPLGGERWLLNFQPVVPITLNEDWNVISRTIVPILDVEDVRSSTSDDSGLGDITQSFFFSPKAPTADGMIWGAGPVLLLPTATDDNLGAEQFGLGPTAVGLKQDGPVTFGALGNHLWSIAGDDSRSDVNATYLQPFVTYTTPQATTFGLNLEATYDWQGEDAAVPINATFAQLVKLGGHPVQFGFGLRYWLESADNGPEEWGFRFFVTPLFPK